MPASQTGFGNFFLDRSINMAAGYQIPVLGNLPNHVQQQQQQHQQQVHHLAAMAAGVPITYSGLQGYNFIPFPQHRHITHTTNGFDLKAVSPYHHALLARGGAFYPSYRPGATEDPSRVTKVATRESTGALKAWLNEHLKNPYPTKGEKIMLAIITKMSLTQVSTWFANARRRLKKENRVSWASRGKSDEEDEEHEGESEDEEDVSLQNLDEAEAEAEPECQDADARIQGAQGKPAPVDARLEMPQQQQQQQKQSHPLEDAEIALVKQVEKSDSDHTPSGLDTKENVSNPKPKIWSLAETATSDTPVKKHLDSLYHPAGKLWADWASRSGLFVPQCYTTREIV